jgi:hypothetical protein
MEKNKSSLKPWILFIISALLLSAGWMLKPFPVFVLIGFAPLFAIVDHVKEDDAFWTNIEFILLALGVSYFAAYQFDSKHIVGAMVHAIVFTLSFLGYNYAHQQLGDRLGKFTILFFWLALEYLLLKLPWRTHIMFLADSFKMKQSWLNWNLQGGYLALSLWILLCNLLVYVGVFKSGIKAGWLIAAFMLMVVPIVYSHFFIHAGGIDKTQMLSLYSSLKTVDGHYARVGELTARTATWVSLLILLLAFVKNKTKS